MGTIIEAFSKCLAYSQLRAFPGILVCLNGNPITFFNYLELMEEGSDFKFKKFSFLREKINSLIPPDAVFLKSEGIEMKKEEEENLGIESITGEETLNTIHLFSQSFQISNNSNNCNYIISDK